MNEQTANILACFFASGVCLEGIVHPKIKKIVSLFTHPSDIQNLHDFLSDAKKKFEDCW